MEWKQSLTEFASEAKDPKSYEWTWSEGVHDDDIIMISSDLGHTYDNIIILFAGFMLVYFQFLEFSCLFHKTSIIWGFVFTEEHKQNKLVVF